MKSKFIVLAIAAIVSVSSVQAAHAESGVAGVRANADIQVQTNTDRNDANMRASTSAAVKGNATSTAARNKDASNNTNANGKLTSESHRSVVATFVHSLIEVADREGGIGSQVRVVAQSQNDSGSTTANAIEKVDDRGSFHTFFTGSDYKNLGAMRSEIATTSANIAKTKVLLSQATNDADRVELSAQIKALEDEQVKIEAYVKANQEKFSLFGWFTRLFVK